MCLLLFEGAAVPARCLAVSAPGPPAGGPAGLAMGPQSGLPAALRPLHELCAALSCSPSIVAALLASVSA